MPLARAIICTLLLCVLPARADTTTVAVASNFRQAMEQLVAEFEKRSGHEVRVAYGSSGKLYAQILHGAPFDAFFSADRAKPDALVRGERSVAGWRFTYAVGALVLWARDATVTGPGWLRNTSFRRIALANPRLAPYGAAATQTLDALGLTEATRARWVQGENIAQTYQFVATGNADAGFVARAQLGEDSAATAWLVPPALHEPIRQDVVLLQRGAGNAAAAALLTFVRSEAGRGIIARYGYRNVVEDGDS